MDTSSTSVDLDPQYATAMARGPGIDEDDLQGDRELGSLQAEKERGRKEQAQVEAHNTAIQRLELQRDRLKCVGGPLSIPLVQSATGGKQMLFRLFSSMHDDEPDSSDNSSPSVVKVVSPLPPQVYMPPPPNPQENHVLSKLEILLLGKQDIEEKKAEDAGFARLEQLLMEQQQARIQQEASKRKAAEESGKKPKKQRKKLESAHMSILPPLPMAMFDPGPSPPPPPPPAPAAQPMMGAPIEILNPTPSVAGSKAGTIPESVSIQEASQEWLSTAITKSDIEILPSQAEIDSVSTSSFSISSELEMESFDPALIGKIPEIADRLLELYIAREKCLLGKYAFEGGEIRVCQRGSEANSSSEPSNSQVQSQYCSSAGIRTTSRNVQGKRTREDKEDDDDEERGVRRDPSFEESPKIEEEVLWACPFYQKDRVRYRSHGTAVLRTISRVKQHIKICHQQPIHCDRCAQTFSTRTELKEHCRMEPRCSLRDEVEWDGTTEDQREELHKRTSRKQSEKEKWYQIYGLLFPGASVPDSPYLEVAKSEELRGLLAFADLKRRSVMDDVLAGVPAYEGLQPEELRELANAVAEAFLPLLVERYESSQAALESSQQIEHRYMVTRPTFGLPASNVEASPSRAGLRTSPPSEYPHETSASSLEIQSSDTGESQYLVSHPETTLQLSTSLDDLDDCPQSFQAGEDIDVPRTGMAFLSSKCNDPTTRKLPTSLDNSLDWLRSSQAGEDLDWSYWDGYDLDAELIT